MAETDSYNILDDDMLDLVAGGKNEIPPIDKTPPLNSQESP